MVTRLSGGYGWLLVVTSGYGWFGVVSCGYEWMRVVTGVSDPSLITGGHIFYKKIVNDFWVN